MTFFNSPMGNWKFTYTISADSRYLVKASLKSGVFSVQHFKKMNKQENFSAHEGVIQNLVFSSDSRYLLTLSRDSLQIWRCSDFLNLKTV
mmetsp:Transcript_28226/g.27187  ORF Transcript_28226/g.27187 Transcript_28226/m.27187 type:complete len:90 (+) Transcript_28226:456-725(+)